MGFYEGRPVLVTGGASFIGSNLVEKLLHAGAKVRVVDDLSSGRKGNLSHVKDDIELVVTNLLDPSAATDVSKNQEVVFHLAADHGGRGYVDLHQSACATNMALDQNLFAAALASKVDKFVFASSGCIYPINIQNDLGEELYLTEEMAGPPYDPDGMYGWAKLGGELTLKALHKEKGLASASCRYFTVYGPRGIENHAVM
ncbi:MAG: NAD-dependent epimerase/dehydratase family protein, partial [Acidimicrobiia bacterium]